MLNPQPRPQTPTFVQNVLLCGLIFGCAAGFRMETDRRAGRGFFGLGEGSPQNELDHSASGRDGIIFAVLRTVVGYSLVLVTRTVTKEVLVAAFRSMGFEPNPAKASKADDEASPKKLELTGWDLWALAIVKWLVYVALAWVITCGCPAF